jgi:toxin ParE1/3/4
MIPYDITPAAEADLREIARYTRSQWGEAQSRRYGRRLASCFERIAAGEAVRRSFSERFPDLLTTRCEHHFVFYLQPEGRKPQIIAVLHERMDMIARLWDRLT